MAGMNWDGAILSVISLICAWLMKRPSAEKYFEPQHRKIWIGIFLALAIAGVLAFSGIIRLERGEWAPQNGI